VDTNAGENKNEEVKMIDTSDQGALIRDKELAKSAKKAALEA
jgi:hypothetical protein